MLSPRGKANMTPSSQIMLADESSVTCCTGCSKKFNIIIKKHHCRSCGDVFCGQCSTKKTLMKGNHIIIYIKMIHNIDINIKVHVKSSKGSVKSALATSKLNNCLLLRAILNRMALK